MNKIWTPAELNYIREKSATQSDKEMAIALTQIAGRHVSVQSVRKQRYKMGIKKKGIKGKFWLA